jgi:hypothetical protein
MGAIRKKRNLAHVTRAASAVTGPGSKAFYRAETGNTINTFLVFALMKKLISHPSTKQPPIKVEVL